MQREYVLGVDIGTTNAKAMLVGADGALELVREGLRTDPLNTPSTRAR